MLQVTAVVQPAPRDGKRRDYAFVHFADHSVVERLISESDKGNRPSLDGTTLEVGRLKHQNQASSSAALKLHLRWRQRSSVTQPLLPVSSCL